MLGRSLAGLTFALVICGIVVAEDTRGSVVKVEDGSITIRTGGGFGKNKEKGEEKTFKVSKDVKVVRVAGKDKEEVKLTLDELKTAVKVTNVFVTVTHEGDAGTEIKVGGFGTGGRGKRKKDDK
jgi:PII-like signaling protein